MNTSEEKNRLKDQLIQLWNQRDKFDKFSSNWYDYEDRAGVIADKLCADYGVQCTKYQNGININLIYIFFLD